MSILSSIFTTGASDLVKTLGATADKLFTSDDERNQFKLQMKRIIAQQTTTMYKHTEMEQSELTRRHESDMKSGSWLSNNVRPLTLIFMVISTTLLIYCTIFCELTTAQLGAANSLISGVLMPILVSVLGFYFGGRSMEKLLHVREKGKLDRHVVSERISGVDKITKKVVDDID